MKELVPQDFSSVEEMKKYLFQVIDTKVESNIRQGFTFAGRTFSMSDSAQINWSNFPQIPDSEFPIQINTKDDTETYSLSLSNRMNFYLTVMGFKNQKLQEGNALKQQVRAMSTIEELSSFLSTLI